jgi:hypothetical protein
MCGCDCCQSPGNPTCFDPNLMKDDGRSFQGWVCGCTCPGCITRLIDGAMACAAIRTMNEYSDIKTSLSAAGDDSATAELPTSVASAGEGYGAHNGALTPWDMRVLVEMLQSARALVESEDFDGFALGRATGRAEERDRIRQAVEALPSWYDSWRITDVLAAIDGETSDE